MNFNFDSLMDTISNLRERGAEYANAAMDKTKDAARLAKLTVSLTGEKDALKKAVQDAREKAEVIAEASGEEIDSVVTISENEQYSYYNTDSRAYIMKSESADAGAGTTVRAAQINVSADVQITYRLK